MFYLHFNKSEYVETLHFYIFEYKNNINSEQSLCSPINSF